MAAIRTVKKELEEDGLNLSIAKTGILINQRKLKERLQPLLTEDHPKIVDVMRDLGIDSAGARLGRVQAFRKRQQKGNKKKINLNNLRITKSRPQNAWTVMRERENGKATAYLEEGKWEYEELDRWTKHGHQPAHHLAISLHDPWPAIKETLQRDAKIRRLQRIASWKA